MVMVVLPCPQVKGGGIFGQVPVHALASPLPPFPPSHPLLPVKTRTLNPEPEPRTRTLPLPPGDQAG